MAIAPREAVVAAERPEDGDTKGRQGGTEKGFVAVAAHPVEHHARDGEVGVETGEAVDQGRHGRTHGRGVNDEYDRRFEQGGDVGGTADGCRAGAVEESHDALDDQHVGARAGPGREGCDDRLAAHPRVEIAARTAGGDSVVSGVDEVGPDFG